MHVYVQEWTESEEGWGKRPDGLSIHHTLEQHTEYLRKHTEPWGPVTPKYYSYPDGMVRMVKINPKELGKESEAMLASVLANKTYRTYKNNPPWLRNAK